MKKLLRSALSVLALVTAFGPLSPNEALARTQSVSDSDAWAFVSGLDTPDAYSAYLRLFPRGIHADESRERLLAFAAQGLVPNDDTGLCFCHRGSSRLELMLLRTLAENDDCNIAVSYAA
jgi:hypothetical protein